MSNGEKVDPEQVQEYTNEAREIVSSSFDNPDLDIIEFGINKAHNIIDEMAVVEDGGKDAVAAMAKINKWIVDGLILIADIQGGNIDEEDALGISYHEIIKPVQGNKKGNPTYSDLSYIVHRAIKFKYNQIFESN